MSTINYNPIWRTSQGVTEEDFNNLSSKITPDIENILNKLDDKTLGDAINVMTASIRNNPNASPSTVLQSLSGFGDMIDKATGGAYSQAVNQAGITKTKGVGLTNTNIANNDKTSNSVAPRTPAYLASEASNPSKYTFGQGDTLASIASKNGTTVQALASANGIPDPTNFKVTPGTSISIPQNTQGGGSTATGNTGGLNSASSITGTTGSGLPSTGDPAMDAFQNETATTIAALYATGAIPTSLELTPANVAQILSIAKGQVAPQTAQYIDNEITGLNANIKNLGNQFVNSQGQIIQDFGTGLATEQNTAGGNGTAFSGQRALNETNMANTTNRNLASLASTTENAIGGALRTSASNVGSGYTDQFNLPSLNGATVGITGGQRGNTQTSNGLNYSYNPSLYTVGQINSDQSTKAQNLTSSYISQYGTLAGNPANSNRSVSDLLGSVNGLSGNTFN